MSKTRPRSARVQGHIRHYIVKRIPCVPGNMSTAAGSVRRRLPPESYTVAWVCALPLELQAARAILDEEHQDPPCEPHETNVYCLGRIGLHNVVVVCLPAGRYGTNSAAACAAEMIQKFRSINFGFLVGIGGGVPSTDADVRLGDVVISQPRGQYGGVVQYDLGKLEAGGKARRTGYLCPPPTMLLNALAKFQALQKYQSNNILARLSPIMVHKPDLDILYESSYDHVGVPPARSAILRGCSNGNSEVKNFRFITGSSLRAIRS